MSIRAILVLLMALVLPGCVKATLAWADLKPSGSPARPAIIAVNNIDTTSAEIDSNTIQLSTIENWEQTHKPRLKKALQEHIYGVLPEASSINIISRKTLDKQAFGGNATLEEITLTATAQFSDQYNTTSPFIIELITPNNAEGPVPLILKQSFSPRWGAVPHPDIAGGQEHPTNSANGIIKFVFGLYVEPPPIKDIIERGYALAVVYPSEFVPDNSTSGLMALRALSKGHADNQTRWGAIAAWGWGYSRMIDAVSNDPRIRYGKAALIAGVFDDRIAAVVSHQSGTGGASLNRQKKGESIEEITSSYPHWFSKKYASYAAREEDIPTDQHHVLALLAPRPVFLGNARRDVWSDPNGALKAAIGADPVWKLYDPKIGLNQSKLVPFKPESEISLWIRPGTHGVVKEDWPAFLSFLDAHL